MSKIEDFLNEKICLDAINSKPEDIKTLSDIIKNEFPNRIVPQEGCSSYEEDSKELYTYWKNVFADGWEVVFVHKDTPLENMMNTLDAFKDEGAKLYAKTHPVKTAAEILDSIKIISIQEDDLMSLFD